MTTLDVVLRSLAGGQLIFLASLLFLRSRGDPALRYAGLLPVGLAAFMLTSAPMPRGALGSFGVPLTLVCVANPAWFWISAQAWFDDDFRPGWREIAGVLAMCAIGAAHEIGSAGAAPPMLDAAFKAAILAFIGLAVVKVVRDRPADLDEVRRRGRVAFVVAVWLYATVGIVLQLVFDGRLPATLVRANVAFLFVVAFGLSATLALGAPALARRPRKVKGAGSPEEADHAPALARVPARRVRSSPSIDIELVERIRAAMEPEHLYRREPLTVASLAAAIGSQEYRVRRAINQGLGYRNFNEFLHRYRLDEASARLRTQLHLPILTIALDVGFGSIGPFNRAFRARFGCTPTAWRNGPATPPGAVEGARGDPEVAAI